MTLQEGGLSLWFGWLAKRKQLNACSQAGQPPPCKPVAGKMTACVLSTRPAANNQLIFTGQLIWSLI